VVTHQLQVKRRTGKVRRPETDVLPLSHATTGRQYFLLKTALTVSSVNELRLTAALSAARPTKICGEE